MIDKNVLIKNLEDFKNNETYTTEKLALFLYTNPITSDFYKNHVKEINEYIKKSPRTIIKYSKEYNEQFLQKTYSSQELDIIKNINTKNLLTFWILDLIKNGENLSNSHGVRLRLAIRVHLDNKALNDLIDYVIKFCIIPYSEHKSVDNNMLTPAEKIVLELIHQGYTVPTIAEKLQCSIRTIENHKKNICKKIDDLNSEEYKDKKALGKLRILANEIFK